MTKRFLLATMIAMVSVWTQAGQTMWIHTGHVHWAYNTESVGTMPYSSANLLTVLDKGFTLADVDSVTVDSQTLADDNVLVKYNGGSADVFVAGNIANHITALIDHLLSDADAGINLQAADVQGDGEINIGDVTALIDLLLAGN